MKLILTILADAISLTCKAQKQLTYCNRLIQACSQFYKLRSKLYNCIMIHNQNEYYFKGMAKKLLTITE